MVFCNIMLYNTIAVQKIGMTEDLSALVSGPINEIQGGENGQIQKSQQLDYLREWRKKYEKASNIHPVGNGHGAELSSACRRLHRTGCRRDRKSVV